MQFTSVIRNVFNDSAFIFSIYSDKKVFVLILIILFLFHIFQSALEAQLLQPRMDCMNGNSQIGCMVAIQNGLVILILLMENKLIFY